MTRALALTIAAVAASALVACGEDDESGSRAGATSAEDGAFKFAKCMRDNGIDMPDPQVESGGRIRLGAGPDRQQGRGIDPDRPKFQAAEKACRKHLGKGVQELPAEKKAELRDAGVKYATCMRGKGIDMPDPQADGGMVIERGKNPGLDPESPRFQAAHEGCKQHLADILDGGPSHSTSKP